MPWPYPWDEIAKYNMVTRNLVLNSGFNVKEKVPSNQFFKFIGWLRARRVFTTFQLCGDDEGLFEM